MLTTMSYASWSRVRAAAAIERTGVSPGSADHARKPSVCQVCRHNLSIEAEAIGLEATYFSVRLAPATATCSSVRSRMIRTSR